METSTVGDGAAILTVAASLAWTARAASQSSKQPFLFEPAGRWAYSLRPLGILLPVAAAFFVQGRFIAGTDKNPGQKIGLTLRNTGVAGVLSSVFNFLAHEKIGQDTNAMGIRLFLGLGFGCVAAMGVALNAYSS